MARRAPSPDFGPAEFQAATGVSRETLGRLQAYADLLNRWTQRINLVAGATLPDIWRRHLYDSAQLAPLVAPGASVVDCGSGAGFPGLVLALMDVGQVTLVESDKRKAAFLREAARVTGTQATIFADRLGELAGRFDVVTARAFAPLPRLLAATQHLVDNRSRYILLKGQDIDQELTAATTSWKLSVDRSPSRTDSRGVIVQLTQVQPR